MEENKNALDEINKGAEMGMDAIHFILDKVEDDSFKKVLNIEYNKYEKITERINSVYNLYNKEKEPHEPNKMTKAMTWYGIEMKTLTDKSNSKIAELLLQGTNMGIISGVRIYNNKTLDKKVKDIVKEFVTMQEDSVEILKDYL